jgi:hypothetical protein
MEEPGDVGIGGGKLRKSELHHAKLSDSNYNGN